jgi:hypothetical protein
MKSTVSFSMSPAGPATGARQLSVPIVALGAVFLAVGIVSGGVAYAQRSPVRAVHSAGTAAWWPHLGVFVFCAAFFAGAWLRRRRTRPTHGGRLFLLAPLGKPAARRIGRTVAAARHRPAALARLAAAAVPAALLLYLCWRVGDQILGGLDPNFTANAWGGPTYLGAMACHYLDAVAMTIPLVGLLNLLLLPDGPPRSATLGG